MIGYSILKRAQLSVWNWCSNTCEYLAEMYKWLYSKTIELGTVMFLFWNFPEVLCNFFVSNNCFCWHQFSSVHFSRSVVPDSLWPHGLQHTKPSCPSQTARVYPNSQSLLKLISIELVMPSKHLILCRPFLLQPSIFSSIRDFSNESVFCIKWPKYWSFSLNISSLPA